MAKQSADKGRKATRDDVTSVLGHVDEDKVLAILDLRPTIAELEQASVWLSGDTDVFGASRPLKHVSSRIVTLLTMDEEEEPPRAS